MMNLLVYRRFASLAFRRGQVPCGNTRAKQMAQGVSTDKGGICRNWGEVVGEHGSSPKGKSYVERSDVRAACFHRGRYKVEDLFLAAS